MQGKVWIVGAGPGPVDLLTVRAVRLLRAAQVVLHDDLVSLEILALCPQSANVINVGKRCGRRGYSQQQINALMIQHARRGRSVVRLKSGDLASARGILAPAVLIVGRVAQKRDLSEAQSAAGLAYDACVRAEAESHDLL